MLKAKIVYLFKYQQLELRHISGEKEHTFLTLTKYGDLFMEGYKIQESKDRDKLWEILCRYFLPYQTDIVSYFDVKYFCEDMNLIDKFKALGWRMIAGPL